MPEDYHPPDKASLLAVIHKERENFTSLIDGLTGVQQLTPGVEADWSIKDILGHISAWERVGFDIVQAARHREPLKPYIPSIFESVDNYNAQIYQEVHLKSLEETQIEFEKSHQNFLALIKTLENAFLKSNLPFEGTEELTVQDIISANTHWHYLEHAESITNWIEQQG